MALWDRFLSGKRIQEQQSQITALTAEVSRLQEALPGIYDPDLYLPATGGGSRYFRRLTQSERDLSEVDQQKSQELSYYLWESNPLGRRVINLTTDYIVGEGVTVEATEQDQSLHDAMQKRIDLFWFDP